MTREHTNVVWPAPLPACFESAVSKQGHTTPALHSTRAAKSMSEFDRMSPKPSWWSRPGRPQCCCRIDWSSSSCCCGCRHAPRLCARGCAQPEWSFMRPTCGTTRLHARHAVVAAAGRGRSGGHQCEEFAIGCWCCTAMRLLAVYWVGCLMCLVTLIRWIATVTAFCASV